MSADKALGDDSVAEHHKARKFGNTASTLDARDSLL